MGTHMSTNRKPTCVAKKNEKYARLSPRFAARKARVGSVQSARVATVRPRP